MMAAILNSTMLDSDTIILDSDTLLSSLRFTQKHSHSTLALTQTNSIWFKLIHSHWTWWWQPSCIMKSWIWPSWIQPSNIFLSNSLTLAKIGSHHLHKKTSFIHSDSTWWCHQPCWIQTLPSWIQTPCYLLWLTQKHSHSTLTLTQTNSIWLKLIYSQFRHIERVHLGFRHLVIFSQIHSKTLSLHSDSDSN